MVLAASVADALGSVVLPIALIALYWIPYVRRSQRLAREGRPVARWRVVCFTAGLVVLAVAVVPPIATLADELLAMHMVEHLLIVDFAALLIVLGLTGPVVAPVLHVRAVARLRVLANPVVALPLWALNLFFWHLPVMYEGALRHELLHVVEHATFLGLGIALWMPLFGPLPKPVWFGNLAQLFYIVGVRLVGTVLGNVFLWSGSAFYPYYAGSEARRGITPLNDQVLAGAIMMVEESILTLILFGWLFLKAAREGDERQALLDLASANDVVLTERRAARAVAAGRGEELRRRLLARAGRSDVPAG